MHRPANAAGVSSWAARAYAADVLLHIDGTAVSAGALKTHHPIAGHRERDAGAIAAAPLLLDGYQYRRHARMRHERLETQTRARHGSSHRFVQLDLGHRFAAHGWHRRPAD